MRRDFALVGKVIKMLCYIRPKASILMAEKQLLSINSLKPIQEANNQNFSFFFIVKDIFLIR